MPPETLTSPARTGNLVLKTRVAVLIRNLEEVQRALGAVKRRREDLGRVLKLPTTVADQLASMRVSLNAALEHWNLREWDKLLDQVEAVFDLRDELDKVVEGLLHREGPVRRLEDRRLLEEEVARTDKVAELIHQSLERAIRADFGEKFAELTDLLQSIHDARAEIGGRPASNGSAAMEEAWSKYASELFESSERLFAEYVELVGGVAIRDTGFERGICRIAEEVLRPVGDIGSHSLTIPARQEALSLTAARVVRLGFPEWTIWTLPLTAYELGNDFNDRDVDVAKYLAQMDGASEALLVCLADAFATYFMGPAYACAAVLMRLNPTTAFADDALIAKRVAVILSVLAKMSQESAPQDHFGPIARRLAVEWMDALRQTAALARARDRKLGDDAPMPKPAGLLEPDDEQLVLRATGVTPDELFALHEAVAGFDRYLFSKRLDIKSWPDVQEWADKLRGDWADALAEGGDGAGDVLVAELKKYDQLRYVLNAAWLARIAVDAGEEDVDDPVELNQIADTAEALLWSLIERAGRSPRPSGEASRRRQARPRLAPTPAVQGTALTRGTEPR